MATPGNMEGDRQSTPEDDSSDHMRFPRKDMKWNAPDFVDSLPEERKNFCIKVTDIICRAVGLEYLDRLACAWAIIKCMPDVTYEKLTSRLIIELAASSNLTYDDGVHHRLAEIMKELRTPRLVELHTGGNNPVQEMLGSDMELIDLSGILAVNLYERQLLVEADEPNAQHGFINICSFAGMLAMNGTINRCDVAIHILMRTLEARRTTD
ncbi:hypothetical protein ACHAQH_006793 [Verticillium albo-atrum]